MIVMKFGGSSVESASAIGRVAAIVKACAEQKPVVVVSAMGKTTNKLLAIAAAAIGGEREDYLSQLHDLRSFHSREARKVVPLADRAELDRTLDEHFRSEERRVGKECRSRWSFRPNRKRLTFCMRSITTAAFRSSASCPALRGAR